jgi:hypothetical protein
MGGMGRNGLEESTAKDAADAEPSEKEAFSTIS